MENRRGPEPSAGSSDWDAVDWLLEALDGGTGTLPPLETLLESNVFRRGGTSEESRNQNQALESFHAWAMALDAPLLSPEAKTESRLQVPTRKGKGVTQKNASPYVAHKNTVSLQPKETNQSPFKSRRGADAGKRAETIQTYMQFFQSSQRESDQSSTQQLAILDAKQRLKLAIAAHVSKEASAQNRGKMRSRPERKRDSWSTLMSVRGGTFEALAREKEKAAMAKQIFAQGGGIDDGPAASIQVDRVDTLDVSHSLLEASQPASSHDPLYRIMREESELALRRHHEAAEGRSIGGKVGNSEIAKAIKAAAVYDKTARRVMHEQAATSTRMLQPSDLIALHTFANVDTEMWVQLRAVYFLLISYYELMSARGVFGAGSVTSNESAAVSKRAAPGVFPQLVRPEPNNDAAISDSKFFQSMSSSVNLGLLWELLAKQCREFDISSATVADRFSWHLFRALLELPEELSCALVYVERGEETYDDMVAAMLEGRRSAVDCWRDSTFYTTFPEDYLVHLRTLTASSVFHPVATLMKSVGCAHLCAWARRVTAGLYAAKTASLRSKAPVESGSAFASLASEPNYDEGSSLSLLQSGEASSIFERSSLSQQSPRRRIEQFVNYPGTAAGGGIMMTAARLLDGNAFEPPKKRSLSFVAAVPVALDGDRLAEEHLCIFNATMLLARPLDRVDVCLLAASERIPGEDAFTQMSTLFAHGYLEARIVALSHSPLHRVVLADSVAQEEPLLEDGVVTISIKDSRGQGRKRGRGVPGPVNALTHASSVSADLLVVDVAGLTAPLVSSASPSPTPSCSVALVYGRHWALTLMAENATWPISRFVVFVSSSAASSAAFSLTLQLAKPCDLIFLIHAMVQPRDAGEERAASLVSEYRQRGYNVHLDLPRSEEEDDDAEIETFPRAVPRPDPRATLATRLVAAARYYEPTHVLMGADSTDLSYALNGAAFSLQNGRDESRSLAQNIVSFAVDEALAGSHTLILVPQPK